MKKVDSVEEYIEVNSHFGEALTLLRTIINSTDLEETLKWNSPVYEIHGKNVLGIGAFKEHFGIWFFNGVFLKDDLKLLVASSDSTKGLRQMRFESMDEIDKNAVLSYVKEAIENQKLGKELKPEKKGDTVSIPLELQKCFDEDIKLKKCFEQLTPYKQREYAEFITIAKRPETKQSRLRKIAPMILKGIGLNNAY